MAKRSPSLSSAKKHSAPTLSLLVVDDEKNILRAVLRTFRRSEYRLLTASTALEALQILQTEDIQVLVSDVRMPGMDGGELINLVSRSFPHVVTLLFSGYSELESVYGGVEDCPAFALIHKPWKNEDLVNQVRLAFEAHFSRQERGVIAG